VTSIVSAAEAADLAAALDLDVDDIGICLACLSFVSFALDSGNERKVAGEITRIAPDLWVEGLAQPVRMALQRAWERGVANAGAAIAEVEASGPRSRTVRAIVRRLAADLSARAQGDLLKMGFEPWPPRELA
jgi:hypothetical protein